MNPHKRIKIVKARSRSPIAGNFLCGEARDKRRGFRNADPSPLGVRVRCARLRRQLNLSAAELLEARADRNHASRLAEPSHRRENVTGLMVRDAAITIFHREVGKRALSLAPRTTARVSSAGSIREKGGFA